MKPKIKGKETAGVGLMTDGIIWKQLLLFSLPLLIGNLFQQLYNMVDSIVVGNFIGGSALAAVGAGSAVINLLIGLFMGLTTGAGVVIAQFYGARDQEKVHQAVHTSAAFVLIFGLVLTILGLVLCKPILSWIHTPANVFDQAALYLRIYFLGMIPLMIYNMAAGVLRSIGNSKSPLYYLAFACLLNIVLDILFVAVVGMNVEGVAIATVLAETLAAILATRKLLKTREMYRFIPRCIRIYPDRLRRILMVGIPTGLQQMIISLSNLVVQSHINSFGSDAMAGWNAYSKVDGIMILPVMSFGLAITTFTGQNVGANRADRVHHGVKSCLKMSCGFTVCATIGVMIFCPMIIRIFTKEIPVIEYGIHMLRSMIPAYFLLAIMQILAGAISGSGHSLPTMIIMVGNLCGVRILWLTLAGSFIHSLWLVYLSYLITWVTGTLCLIGYYYKGSWKKELHEDGSWIL